MAQIMTLCAGCEKELLNSMFKVKPVPTMELQTPKLERCEYCGRKFGTADLKQYTVHGR